MTFAYYYTHYLIEKRKTRVLERRRWLRRRSLPPPLEGQDLFLEDRLINFGDSGNYTATEFYTGDGESNETYLEDAWHRDRREEDIYFGDRLQKQEVRVPFYDVADQEKAKRKPF